MMRRPLLILLACAAGLAGCAGRTPRWDGAPIPVGLPPPPDSGHAAEAQRLVAEGDVSWTQRDDPAGLEAALVRFESALKLRPDAPDLLTRASRAWHFRGEVHLADDPIGRLQAFDRGLAYAERALLAASPALARRLRNGATILRAIDVVGPEGLDALYWYAANLWAWAGEKGFVARVAWRDEVEAALLRVLTLDERWPEGGALRLLGCVFGELPVWAGGDRALAEDYLERAVETAPGRLASRVDLAELVAVPRGDAALFVSQLRAVLHAAEGPPALAPENRWARARARRLLQEHAGLAETAEGAAP